MKILTRYCWILFLLLPGLVMSQDVLDDIDEEEIERVSTTSFSPKHKKGSIKDRPIVYYIIHDTKKIPYGNKCLHKLTDKMGIVFHLETPMEHTGSYRTSLQNWNAGWTMFWRYGPFWKAKIRKRARKCRDLSGDRVG